MNVGTSIDLPQQSLHYDPARGQSSIYGFEGTLEACLAKAIALLQVKPHIAWDLESADPPLFRISVRSPDLGTTEPDAITTTWELLGNDVAKDIYESPLALEVPDSELNIIKEAAENHSTIQSVQASLGDAGLALLVLVKRGTTSFLTGEYVLRKTQVLSQDSSTSDLRITAGVPKAYFGTGGTWSSAGLIAFEQLPATLLFALDQIPALVVPNSDPVVVLSEIYAVGWLKKTPTLTQVANNKFQLSQEFLYNIWPVDLYPAVQ